MRETENYGLYIEDGSSETFLNWRKKMNGSDNSNMVKIDTALVAKADKSAEVSSVLKASAWKGKSSPFVQTIAVEGLGATQNGDIALPQTATDTEFHAACDAVLRATGQDVNALTITAFGHKPTIDIPVIIRLLG